MLDELGRGGMGSVYLAVREDEAYRKEMAIKTVRVAWDEEILRDTAVAEHDTEAAERVGDDRGWRRADGGSRGSFQGPSSRHYAGTSVDTAGS